MARRSPRRSGPGFNHLAFNAATQAEFRDAQAHLAQRGVRFEFQDREISHSIYFDDPDGRPLEITTYDVPSRL